MLRVGLTGGLGSGKSTVAGMFAELGAAVIGADQLGRQLMQPGEPVYAAIVQRFGASVVRADGSLDRKALAELAFQHNQADALNRIVHPAVMERENQWMEEIGRRDSNAIAMVEAALILESGGAERFDRLVVVTCTPAQRVQRFAHRLGISEDAARVEVARRMAAQIPDDEKVKAADFVIDNSGSLDATEAQVRDVLAQLRADGA